MSDTTGVQPPPASFENPSADKFGPPPGSRPPDPPGGRPERSTALALTGFLLVVVREGLRFVHYRPGGFTWFVPVAFIALAVASYLVDRKRRAELNRDNPYSEPTHLTR